MARIGVLPTKTSIELREPDGDAGTLPAATAASAGVMTARHVQMLEDVWQRLQGGALVVHEPRHAEPPMIIERAADISHLATKAELRALVSALPRAIDLTPQMQSLREEVANLQRESMDTAQRLLSAPPTSTDVVDHVSRQVLDGVIAGFESLEQRVRAVEDVVDAIRTLADIKGQDAA